jgi:trimethylamine--corrinoid protein Co-methyltransferase
MMRMQITVSDVPTPDCYLKTMEVFLCHLNKHITIYPTSVENCREWMDVYEVIADAAGLDVKTTPLMSVAMAVTSPLQVHGPNVDIMKLATERCYPVIGTVCTMAGTTSPYTLEGTALVSIVEALAVVLITQALKPGHPVTFGFGPSATDMRSGHDLYYKAEKALWKAMCVEMGKFYNLPVSASTGGSLTHLPDMQNGAESMAFILTSHLSGQHIYGGLGSMGNANGMSAEQIIMQAGLLDMAEYLIRDIDLSDQRLALDNIHEIGPGGNYLTDLLTIELMRSGEYFESPCFDLSGGYDNNAKGMYEIAHETAEQLIADYKPVLSDKVTTAIKTFFQQRYKDPAIAEL